MKKLLIYVILLFILNVWWCCECESDGYQHFPKNDFLTIINDISKKLGLDNIISRVNQYLKTSVRQGQRYTMNQFNYDVQTLKNDPSTIISFLRKITWPIVVQSYLQVVDVVTYAQNYLLLFMKKKCDTYMGGDALFHPWNLLNDKDRQNVSFIVFVYASAISLILVRFLSWWNFMVYVAVSFLLYSFGGPYLVFKWLLCITGAFWLLLDIALTYPLQLAVIILALFALSYVKGVFSFVIPTATGGKDRYDAPPPYKFERRFQSIDREYQTLTSRLENMEEKTALLNSKLEMLSKSMDRLAQIDDD